jgi:hypothetical protein
MGIKIRWVDNLGDSQLIGGGLNTRGYLGELLVFTISYNPRGDVNHHWSLNVKGGLPGIKIKRLNYDYPISAKSAAEKYLSSWVAAACVCAVMI